MVMTRIVFACAVALLLSQQHVHSFAVEALTGPITEQFKSENIIGNVKGVAIDAVSQLVLEDPLKQKINEKIPDITVTVPYLGTFSAQGAFWALEKAVRRVMLNDKPDETVHFALLVTRNLVAEEVACAGERFICGEELANRGFAGLIAHQMAYNTTRAYTAAAYKAYKVATQKKW